MSPIVSVKLSEAVKFLLAYKILTATNKFWKKTAKILYFFQYLLFMNQKLVLKAGRLPKYINKNKRNYLLRRRHNQEKKKESQLKTAALLLKSY